MYCSDRCSSGTGWQNRNNNEIYGVVRGFTEVKNLAIYANISLMARKYGIGNTPLAEFRFDNGSVIYPKLEYHNRFRSVKDRAAFFLINASIIKGTLTKDRTIIEASSGNTGIAIANLAAIFGYSAEILVPASSSEETKEMIRSTGALLVEVEDEASRAGRINIDGSLKVLKEKMQQYPDRYVNLDQYSNDANTMGHFYTTGPEIVRDIGKNITHVMAGIGTGGTITGLSRYFKKVDRNIRTIAIEPVPGHHIQGLKNLTVSSVPPILERNMQFIDEWVSVTDENAKEGVLRLLKDYNMFVGLSSGAAFSASLNIARQHPGSRIVTVFPDSAEKYRNIYLRNGLFSQEDFDAHIFEWRGFEEKGNYRNFPVMNLQTTVKQDN